VSAVLIGLALALCASLAQGVGYLCQHLNADERPPVSARRPLRTLSSMLRSPWWRVGLLLGATGFVLHLSALALAPISLVQAFVAGGLALVAPMAARAFHHHLTPAERRAVPLMAASLAALALGISDPTRHLHFDGTRLGIYLAALMLLATLFATAIDGRFRYPALGLAAGLFYGALDSSTKALADQARTAGFAEVISSPFLFVAIAGGVAAFFCFQRALQTNRPLTAIAVMEAGATGGGVMAGFVAFGDSLGTAPGIQLLHVAAFIGVGIAAWTLAPAQTRLAESAEPVEPVGGVNGRAHGRVQPVPGVAEGGGHLSAPQPPVV
jgi:multidrug transporter EmrE-like cation transporter